MAGYSPIDAQVLQGKPATRAGWRLHRGAARARGLGVVPGYSGRSAGVPFLDLQVLRGMPRAGLPGIGRLGDDGDFSSQDLSDLTGPGVAPDADTFGTLQLPTVPAPSSSLPVWLAGADATSNPTQQVGSTLSSSSGGLNTNALAQMITQAALQIGKSLATPAGTVSIYNPATGAYTQIQGGNSALTSSLNLSSLTAGLTSINPLVWVALAAVGVIFLAKR